MCLLLCVYYKSTSNGYFISDCVAVTSTISSLYILPGILLKQFVRELCIKCSGIDIYFNVRSSANVSSGHCPTYYKPGCDNVVAALLMVVRPTRRANKYFSHGLTRDSEYDSYYAPNDGMKQDRILMYQFTVNAQ